MTTAPGTGEKQKRKHHLSSNHQSIRRMGSAPGSTGPSAQPGGEPSDVTETAERSSSEQDTGLQEHKYSSSVLKLGVHTSCNTAPGSHQPSITLWPHPPFDHSSSRLTETSKPNQAGVHRKEESRESGRSWSSASLPPPPSAPPPRPYPSPRPAVARLLPPPFRYTAASQLEVRPGPSLSLCIRHAVFVLLAIV